eukprot:6213397-Pleurochrysis_carterae.AAC.2
MIVPFLDYLFLYFHCVADQQTPFYNTYVLTQEGVAQNSDTKHFRFHSCLRLRKAGVATQPLCLLLRKG